MYPKITLTPTLRIDRIGSPHGEAQSRRSPFPFSRGQLVQGLITGKNGDHHFYLDVNGTRFVAESRAPLQVGQQLDLQVVATHPRTTLQVVEDPLTREIGKSIHLLTRQDSLLADTAALAEKGMDSPDLSPRARQTLRFFAAAATRLSRPVAPAQHPDQALASLTGRLATASPGDTGARQAVAALRELLGQLAQTGRDRPGAAALAGETLRELGILEESLPPGPAFLVQRQPAGPAGDRGPAAGLRIILQQLDQAAAGGPGNEAVADLLLSLFPDRQPRPSRLLLLILDLHQQLSAPGKSSSPVRLQGEDLKRLTNRLGLDMERLLAEGRRGEAVQTLKSALLEISHTMAGTGKADRTPDRLLGTIELYQMLQIRLAPEGLFFLPLPLPFLNQGYLLMDEEPGGSHDGGEEGAKTFHLHLQLEGLGNVQVDISRQGKGLALRFLAQDPERAAFMAGHRDELEQWLTALRLDSASFMAGAGDPAAGLLRKMLPAGSSSGILDTRA
ncbi:MAG TPA: flagellar hook-length control protein FliK [Desulfobulbus sp.]|nr:flagellar hook-length control protein FliK [Desulfobulbus sp.]